MATIDTTIDLQARLTEAETLLVFINRFSFVPDRPYEFAATRLFEALRQPEPRWRDALRETAEHAIDLTATFHARHSNEAFEVLQVAERYL